MEHRRRNWQRPPAFHTNRSTTWQGAFLSGTLSNRNASCPYKLYIPRGYSSSAPTPLLVALHGCSQDPDNFAAGTGFNTLADKHNFLVLYPQQLNTNHPNKCWSWYIPKNQERGSGEPALLAALVDEIKSKYTIDPNRVFITGISAGGAMAVIMGVCYPDYFAAIGVHSGLEYKAASDLKSAQAALVKGGPDPITQGKLAYLASGSVTQALPVIVFHGNNDHTVSPLNSDQVIQQFARLADYTDSSNANISISAHPHNTKTERVPDGYAYTVYNYHHKGKLLLQKYKIESLGHAWSGGSTAPPATFTDPRGPDASTIMWNFFINHPKPATIQTPPPSPVSRRDRSDDDEVIEGVFRYLPD